MRLACSSSGIFIFKLFFISLSCPGLHCWESQRRKGSNQCIPSVLWKMEILIVGSTWSSTCHWIKLHVPNNLNSVWGPSHQGMDPTVPLIPISHHYRWVLFQLACGGFTWHLIIVVTPKERFHRAYLYLYVSLSVSYCSFLCQFWGLLLPWCKTGNQFWNACLCDARNRYHKVKD